ncbi:MAG: hypothetical protein U1F33_00395 [Alphaproteobacteria bacterium]
MIGRRMVGGFLALCLLSLPAAGLAQVDKSAYRPIDYDAIYAENGLAGKPDGDVSLFPPALKYRISVRSTGAMRDLTPGSSELLALWGRMSPQLPAFIARYTREVEIAVGAKTHWVLLQRELVEDYKAEVKPGAAVDLYVVLAGAAKGELLLLATEFEAR